MNAKNGLESLVHNVTKSVKDHGDKLSAEEKSGIESALKNAGDALQSQDTARITAATEKLSEASHKLAEKMYASDTNAGGADVHAQEPGASAGGKEDHVVDAEFEEVKDKK